MNPANYLIPMVELYCQWLNRWTATDPGPPHVYELRQFLKWDPDNDLYGTATVHGVVPNVGTSASRPRFMVVAAISDGDDGGPTDLTAWFEVYDDNTTEIVAMVQGFDTSLQFIYEHGQFKNVPD
jgi:hypothetical protein